MSKNFESGFESFLLSDVYDWAEDVLFRVARAAYLAGWTDAGGRKAGDARGSPPLYSDQGCSPPFCYRGHIPNPSS